MPENESTAKSDVSRETNQQPAEPTPTEQVIASYQKKYEEEHALRIKAEQEANDLARIMTNMTTSKVEEKPKEQSFDELSKKLFGGK